MMAKIRDIGIDVKTPEGQWMEMRIAHSTAHSGSAVDH